MAYADKIHKNSDIQFAPVANQQAPGTSFGESSWQPSNHSLSNPFGSTSIHQTAAFGVQGQGTQLPYFNQIQSAFGHHDISSARAYTGQRATDANNELNSQAYTTGNKVAFASTPSLYVAAHEAAHLVQQQAGVHLKGNFSTPGDRYEQEANQVADKVSKHESAERILDQAVARTDKEPGTLNAGTATATDLPVQTFIDDGLGGHMSEQEFVSKLDGSHLQMYARSRVKWTVLDAI